MHAPDFSTLWEVSRTHRGPRRPAPALPAGELPVPAPPELPAAPPSRWGQLLTLLPMLAGTIASAMMFAGNEGGPYAYLVGGVFGVSSLGVLATSLGSGAGLPGRATVAAARADYLRRLAGLRDTVRETVTQQREALHYRHPDPACLWSTVDSYRLWERRPADPDFTVVRIGLGTQGLATPLIAPLIPPTARPEPVSAAALAAFLDTHARVAGLPVALPLPSFRRIRLAGSPDRTRALARAIVAQLATFHAPDDLRIAACVSDERRAEWDYLKWLPHAGHPTRRDALGPVRLIEPGGADLGDPPRLVVLVDGGDYPAGDYPGGGHPSDGTVIELGDGPADLTLTVDDAGSLARGPEPLGTADALSPPGALAHARRLAPRRLAEQGADTGPAELLGLDLPWAPRAERDLLHVPIGTDPDGRPVRLDLKESARDGMGPHGLLIGATGSGKSELLRTLVLALAASHDPAVLNLVLVDFKGGATFASLDRLPHTAAVITNLRDRLPLLDRMADALNGELVRRQELLRTAGCASARDYRGPLPTLLIVCDEFSELLSAKPDLIDTFVQIGRLGRSLGVHLLLASQRLEEGRLRGLETHLSYRIGLRTFSALESRTVLGVADAYELPRSPGHGFLKAGTEPLRRFRAAYVSGPVAASSPLPAVVPFTAAPVGTPAAEGPTLLDTVVDRLAGAGCPARQVWLPPLDRPVELTDLLGPLVTDPAVGLTVADPALRGRLAVPVALVDKPFEQRRDPLTVDLDGGAGHLAVVGGPRSGKSGLLTTVLCGLALTHPPGRVQAYCLDFGGGALAAVRGLPHVGGVAGRLDRDAVRRTVGELTTRLAAREAGAETGGPDLFLVVDGWTTLRGDYDDLEPVLTDLATRGLGYGIHLIASATRWTDFRPGIRDLFGSRLELRLGDPAESAVSRRAAGDVPERSPGRGLTTDGYHFLAAFPPRTPLVERIAAAWTGPPAPPIRLLPATVAYHEIADPASIVIGVAEADLTPVALDLAADPHFLLFGDAESGKSAFLRALATSITRRYRPEQARIVLVDYRRSLLGALDSEHLIGYGTSAASAAELVESVAGYLRARLPGPDITPAQLRDRSWWTGPDCYLLVDDYDLVASGGPNPLSPLLDYLAQARDVGLHLVLARRSGGAGRALYEPVIQRLRELATPGLVLSGDREEGPLLGAVRPGRLPPGRGWLVTRRAGVRLVQLAYLPPR